MTRLIIDCETGEAVEAPAEAVAIPIPVEVTMRQARLALFGAGLLATAEAALNGLSEPQRTAALIEWEYAATVRRDSPLVTSLGPAIGADEDALDALFVAAKAIQ